MSAHTLLSVSFVPADGRGSIDGHVAVCSCGFRVSTSLSERFARQDLAAHAAYMAAKEARR